MTKALAGVLAPVVTTFDDAGELAPVPFRANIRAYLAAGLSGIVVAGSTGEAALLDEQERLHLVEWARSVIPDDRWLIVGTGAESTRQTIERCVGAADRGADAVLVVAPHYYGGGVSAEGLARHYERVAESSPVPVLLYNIPKYMHFALESGLVRELARHPNIIGMKDSSGDLKLLGGYLGAQSADFTVLTGNGSSFYSALELGVRGGILAISCFAPAETVELFAAFGRGERERAGAAQERLAALSSRVVGQLGVPGVKATLDAVGLEGGPPRLPLLPLRAKQREEVAALVRAAELAEALPSR